MNDIQGVKIAVLKIKSTRKAEKNKNNTFLKTPKTLKNFDKLKNKSGGENQQNSASCLNIKEVNINGFTLTTF